VHLSKLRVLGEPPAVVAELIGMLTGSNIGETAAEQ